MGVTFRKNFSVLLGAAILFCASQSMANEMINNKVHAIVNGDIIQIAGPDTVNEIYVGSIVSDRGVRNVNIRAVVDGDIRVQTRGSDMRLNVGSIVNSKRR